MSRLGLIAASALSLVLATPAIADGVHHVTHRAKVAPRVAPYGYYGTYGDPSLPVDQAIRFGYSQGYANYPSGWGGLYGDGRYPGNTVSNPHYNTLH